MAQRPIRMVNYKGDMVPVSRFLELERARLKDEVDLFNNGFGTLDYSLSSLLHAILGASIRDRIPYAVYYSVTSFDARVTMVENALIEAITQNDKLKPLMAATHWPYLSEKLRTIRNLRNGLAHGSLQNMEIRDKVYVRWVAPASDVIRIGRVLARRQIPGLTAEDVARGKRLVWPIIDCVNDLNLLLRASRREKTAWQERFDGLEEHLQAVRNLYSDAQRKSGPKAPPESSEE